jgi:hypothetical protein
MKLPCYSPRYATVFLAHFFSIFKTSHAADSPRHPRIVRELWRIAGDPDLGGLTSAKLMDKDLAAHAHCHARRSNDR